MAFPALEIYFYNRHRGNVDDPFEDYQWDGATMGMGMEVEEGAKVETIWPGLDCVINSLIPLENVNRAFPRHNSHGDFLPYMPHRAKHPGAGSITPYRSATTLVKRDIPAGGELFKVSLSFGISLSSVDNQLLKCSLKKSHFPELWRPMVSNEAMDV